MYDDTEISSPPCPHQPQWNTELPEEHMGKKSRNPRKPATFFRNQIPVAQVTDREKRIYAFNLFQLPSPRTNWIPKRLAFPKGLFHLCSCISPYSKWQIMLLISVKMETRETRAWRAAQERREGQCWTLIQAECCTAETPCKRTRVFRRRADMQQQIQ